MVKMNSILVIFITQYLVYTNIVLSFYGGIFMTKYVRFRDYSRTV